MEFLVAALSVTTIFGGIYTVMALSDLRQKLAAQQQFIEWWLVSLECRKVNEGYRNSILRDHDN